MSLLLFLGIAALIVLATLWWGIVRLRRIRADEARRSDEALAALRASQRTGDAEAADEVMTFLRDGDFGIDPSSSPDALEVAEFDEGVDIEALLADERERVAQRNRETLAQITQPLSADMHPAEPPPAPAPLPSRVPATPPVSAVPSSAGAVTSSAAGAALPASVVQSAAAGVAPAASGTASSSRSTVAEPLAEAPARSFVGGGDLVRDVQCAPPLREVALAWFEARGYRSAAASPAVRPIERVLRHRNDATRGYAFVVELQPVTERRVEQLQALALSVGLKRLLVVADAGADGRAPRERRGVRLMDRSALAAELDRLDLSIAAKIIAVARKRAAAALV